MSSSQTFENELVGKPRIAKLLGMSRTTVTLHALRGLFPTLQIDGRMFARVSDVLAYRAARDAQRKQKRTA
jgi:hypothetical protein